MDAKKIIQVGQAGTGKSTLTAKIRQSFLDRGFGVLIYDIKSEKIYENVPSITLENFKKWNGKGEYKLSITDKDFSIQTVFEIIRDRAGKLRNFVFVLEDAHGYINPNTAKSIISVFGASRQWGITFLANYWSLRQIPPFFCDMVNYLIVRKTNDSYTKPNHLDKFPKPLEIFTTWKQIQKSSNQYESQTIIIS